MALRSVSALLDDLGAGVWRADALAHAASATGGVLSTGHAALDAQLPGGGWPVGALCEILQAQSGWHEWRLLLPVVSALTAVAGRGQCVVLVGAPHAPFGPGLAAQGLDVRALLWVQAEAPAQRLWAAEQALRCAGVAALLVWLPEVRADHLRRLQLAAQAHAKLLFVMRPAAAQQESSPALLRLLVAAGASAEAASGRVAGAGIDLSDAAADALQVKVLKRRGPPLAQTLTLSARPAQLSVLLALNAGGNLAAPSWTSACAGHAGPHSLNLPVAGPWERDHALDRLAAAA